MTGPRTSSHVGSAGGKLVKAGRAFMQLSNTALVRLYFLHGVCGIGNYVLQMYQCP